ncbi:MAG: hypothetical protein ACTSWR_01165, partial [Candidatus Helarchaeota archaeon]
MEEPDWEKIQEKPEKSYKVSGIYLLDRKKKIVMLEAELKKVQILNQEANSKIKDLEEQLKVQEKTLSDKLAELEQTNDENTKIISDLKLQLTTKDNHIKELKQAINDVQEAVN